jgi:hypothetical protein
MRDRVVSFDVEPPLQHVGVEAKLKNWANVFAVFRDADYEVRGLHAKKPDAIWLTARPPQKARYRGSGHRRRTTAG